jgi:hypothetical protein
MKQIQDFTENSRGVFKKFLRLSFIDVIGLVGRCNANCNIVNVVLTIFTHPT